MPSRWDFTCIETCSNCHHIMDYAVLKSWKDNLVHQTFSHCFTLCKAAKLSLNWFTCPSSRADTYGLAKMLEEI